MRTYYFNFIDEGYTPPTGSGSFGFEMKDIIYIPPDPPDSLPAYYGFSFTAPGYIPPTGSGSYWFEFTISGTECPTEWIDNAYDHWPEDPNRAWGECTEPFTYLKQIWHDNRYVYAATTDGLNIIDMISEQAYAHVTYSGGFNSVWSDDDNVYLATPASGIKYIEKTCISGSIISPYELVTCLKDYLNEPDILSNKVRYIHGNNGYESIVTISGVNVRGPDLYYENSFGTTKLARKCFITSIGKVYYTTYDGSGWQINIVNTSTQDWTTPDKVYSSIFDESIDINDIFVANDIIYVATSSGVYVINDASEDLDYTIYLVEV